LSAPGIPGSVHSPSASLDRSPGRGRTAPTARGQRQVGAGLFGDAGTLEATAPLAIVQMDHTKVDVTVVDPITRLPIGRPTLTLAIDVATRMAMGFHLSLDPPSLTAVALVSDPCGDGQDELAGGSGIEAEWPAQGIPRVIHVDNGAEFHALAFERACAEHGVGLVYRPPERLVSAAISSG